MPAEVDVSPDRAELIRHAAELFVEEAARAIAERGRFTVALSGGSTPLPLYQLLGAQHFAGQIDWSRIHLFFGDERCVPPEHPDSNFRGLEETLLAAVPLPTTQVHRMRGEDEPGRAAAAYEAVLRAAFPAPPDGLPSRSFDLALQGVGEDGHTASLFPGAPALGERSRWVVSTSSPAHPHERLTVTLPVLLASDTIWFLVEGEAKASVVAQILTRGPDVQLPASLAHAASGPTRWLLDAAAAAFLPADQRSSHP